MNTAEFKNFFHLWDNYLTKEKIKKYLDDSDHILFFKYKGEIFGTNEEGRLTFARMKDPKDEDYSEELSFSAMNLSKTIKNDKSESVFSTDDVKNIKILSREEVEKQLKNE